jgi:hypothetical protein
MMGHPRAEQRQKQIPCGNDKQKKNDKQNDKQKVAG